MLNDAEILIRVASKLHIWVADPPVPCILAVKISAEVVHFNSVWCEFLIIFPDHNYMSRRAC